MVIIIHYFTLVHSQIDMAVIVRLESTHGTQKCQNSILQILNHMPFYSHPYNWLANRILHDWVNPYILYILPFGFSYSSFLFLYLSSPVSFVSPRFCSFISRSQLLLLRSPPLAIQITQLRSRSREPYFKPRLNRSLSLAGGEGVDAERFK